MVRVDERLRQAEALLRDAQRAAAFERLWLLTVTWDLLREVADDLGERAAAQRPHLYHEGGGEAPLEHHA